MYDKNVLLLLVVVYNDIHFSVSMVLILVGSVVCLWLLRNGDFVVILLWSGQRLQSLMGVSSRQTTGEY